MGRKRKNENEIQENKVSALNYSTPSDAYSDLAMKTLQRGDYQATRDAALASYRRNEARNKVPELKSTQQTSNASKYQQNLEHRQKSYEYDEQARNNNTLEKRDSWWNWKQSDQDYLQRIYDDFGEEGARRALYQSNRTKDWEQKYGKSYDQILKDFLADQKNVTMQMGESHPLLTEAGTILNSIPNALVTLPSLVTNLVDPESPTAKKYEQMRANTSENQRLLREGVKKNTGNVGDKVIDTVNSVGDRMVNTIVGNQVAPGLGAVMAGLSDANTQLDDLDLRGVDGRQKYASALAHGAVEGIGTAITGGLLDKIPAVEGVKGALLNIGKGAGNAAIENTISELVEMGADTAINKEKSQKELNKAMYMAQGMSEQEATNKAFWDQAKQLGNAALTGALFGGGMRGLTEIGNKIRKVPALDNTDDVSGASKQNVADNADQLTDAQKAALQQELAEESAMGDVEPTTKSESVSTRPELQEENVTANNVVQKVDAVNEGVVSEPDGFVPTHYQNGNGVDLPSERAVRNLSNSNKNVVNDGGNFKDFIQSAVDDNFSNYKRFYYGTVSDELASDLNNSLGIDANGMDIVYDTSHLKHMFDRHGDDAKEATQGFIGLTPDSIADSGRVFDKPYSIRWLDGTNSDGNPVFEISKRVDGVYYVVSGYKEGKNRLAIDSFRIKKNPPKAGYASDNTPQPLRPNANNRSDSFDTTNVTPIDENVKSGVGNVPPTDVGNVIDDGSGNHTKTSKTYTNTGKSGGGWTQEEYNKYTDPSQFQYEDVSEMESIQGASDMLQKEGLEGFRNRVMDKERLSGKEIDGLMMEWRILGDQARKLEETGQDAGDLWKESVKVFRKVQEQSSSNAQALQVLAKWSRNTAEGMLTEAENILNGKKKINQPDKSAVQKEFERFAKQNKKFHFSDEFAEEFLKKAKPLENMDRESREAKELMAELGKMINRQLPAKIGEKVTTVLMDNMLGNFRTLISRNAGGNIGLNTVEQLAQRPLAALIDMGVAKKTGKRTQAGLSKEGLVEYVQGFTKGLKEELADYKKDIHTARSGENDLANAVSSNRHVFKEKGVADKLDKLVRHGLSIGDRPFYEAVYNQTLGDYQRLRASGQMGDIVQSLDDADFDMYAKTAAKLNALSAVYQQNSKMATALLNFKGAIGDLSRGILGTDVLSQFSMPFVKTPANVVERAIDYSPLGLLRNSIRTAKEIKGDAFDQNRFVNEASRNILGTGLMAGGAALAANGGMSGAYSEDKDEKQAQKESGMQEFALNLPDNRQMDISWIPVVGSNLVASAAAYDAYKNGEGGFGQNLAKGIEKGGEALFDQSMFQGLQRLFGTGETYDSDTGIVGNMANVVKSGLGQFLPSLARQSGQVFDPYQRDTGNSNEDWSFGIFDNYDINSLANNIPILREMTLSPKVNTSGELVKENQGRNVASKILEDMILPGKITEVQTTALADEAKRLSDITTNKKAYMPKASRSSIDTDDHTLTNQEWVDYQQKYYKELTAAGTMVTNDEFYKNASPAVQEKLLDGVYTDIKNAINSQYNGKKQDGGAKKYLEAGGGMKGMRAAVEYHLAKEKANELGMDTSTYLKKEAEAPGTAERWAQEREDAVKYGYVQKDGTANVDAFDTALNIVGNNPSALQSYLDYYKKGFTKNEQKLPYLMNDNSFTDEQKGKIIAGSKTYDDFGATAKGAYDLQGYEGLYYYYLLKQLADTDGNGSIKKDEKKALLESDNPYVTSLSDDMYYYLENAKW